MSVYCPSFNYKGINSRRKNLIVANLDGGDQGETETFLSMEPIYTDVADGSRRLDYGAKFNSVAVPKITVIKQDHSDFSSEEVTDCLRWLTGSRNVASMDMMEHFEKEYTYSGSKSFSIASDAELVCAVYINNKQIDESGWSHTVGSGKVNVSASISSGSSVKIEYGKTKFSFVGRVTNVWTHKMDSRVIGLIIEFTSISPFAVSPVQKVVKSIGGSTQITLSNMSDDVDSYVYMKTTFTSSGGSLVLTNNATGEKTEIKNLSSGEIVTLHNNQMILSDKPTRVFGDDFNWHFPRLVYGENVFSASGSGTITFEYTYPIKASYYL